ncbi:predicted protein [Sclerotinia sclerotiorum 1980 UF-70]|uniref:Uncharacterized protein n=1 Tax=Sclerotinia sclerotiorum (strain ATCC 18683 / 1980 / Ss-1) TaxID=665079 RepID=A7ETZ9_SCLS1|nr:predicted protein [Sclerotinia sclerotiorum 1980 UF-70]EDN92941.1 predicted protein [Sclerotinia sclerotiorum 1980 UF-70]
MYAEYGVVYIVAFIAQTWSFRKARTEWLVAIEQEKKNLANGNDAF